MRAAIFNPYLDTLGGGERYTLSFAQVLVSNGYDVDIEWNDLSIREKIESRFGIKTSDKVTFIEDIKRGDGYDVCFWVSDGSIPTLKARKNFLHFQVPFKNVNGNTLLNKMKLFRIDKVLCNSGFTKKIIDEEYGVKSIVVYPPVDTKKIRPMRKKNSILYVGRFSSLVQSKGQEILVEVFKRFFDKGFKDWELNLVGGVEVGVGDFINQLEKKIKGYPINLVKSPDYKTLLNFYGTSKFFWSASGYGINEIKNPERVEHFGITTVEAMAAGCVPIVYNAGGQREIVKDGVNGFLWDKKSQLLNKTIELLKKGSQLQSISKKTKEDSLNFSYEQFEKEILKLL